MTASSPPRTTVNSSSARVKTISRAVSPSTPSSVYRACRISRDPISASASVDAKRKQAYGEDWKRFAAVTSSVPFLAVAQGRNTLQVAEIGWWRVAVALVLYAGFLGIHS